VILLTASDNQLEFVQALKLGCCGIVPKQTATELLIDSIRRVNAGEIWLDSNTTASVIRRFVTNEEAPPQQDSSPADPRELERTLLSPREYEVVSLVAQGFKNKEIADKMLITEHTVKNHLHNIFDKLLVSDRLELALYFVTQRLQVGTSELANGCPLPRLEPRPSFPVRTHNQADTLGCSGSKVWRVMTTLVVWKLTSRSDIRGNRAQQRTARAPAFGGVLASTGAASGGSGYRARNFSGSGASRIPANWQVLPVQSVRETSVLQ
jgi:DNA-binding CsgD family transcriptional regulator